MMLAPKKTDEVKIRLKKTRQATPIAYKSVLMMILTREKMKMERQDMVGGTYVRKGLLSNQVTSEEKSLRFLRRFFL